MMMIGDVILLWNERRCVYLMLGYTGLKYSSPTLASAMSNLTPAFTFIFALLFGYFIFLRNPSSIKFDFDYFQFLSGYLTYVTESN